jgi:hypothetical protein
MRTLGHFVRSTRAVASLFLVFATAAAWAQPSGSAVPQSATAAPQASTAQPDQPTPRADSKADDELLAKTSRLYYSTRTAGLDGFDCQVHPDWHALFSSASQGAVIAEDDARILLLKPVKVTVHARMNGQSTLEWVRAPEPEKPLDSDSSILLDRMHEATEHAMQGFLQFWIPFVDGSFVPASSEGLKVTRSASDFTIQGEQNGTQVTEIFSNEMILQHFNVVTEGVSIRFVPSYQSTEKGLLVNHFDAHIQPIGQASEAAQVMHVQVLYATIVGLFIPSNLNMEVVGTGTFNMAMDGCHTIQASK